MRLWEWITQVRRNRRQRTKEVAANRVSLSSPVFSVRVLEPRRLLNASFGLNGIEISGAEKLTISDGGMQTIGAASDPVQTVSLTLETGTWTIQDGIKPSDFALTDKILTIDARLLHAGPAPEESVENLQLRGTDSDSQHVILDLSKISISWSEILPAGIAFAAGEHSNGNDADVLEVKGYESSHTTLALSENSRATLSVEGLGAIKGQGVDLLITSGNSEKLEISLPNAVDNNVVLGPGKTVNDQYSEISGDSFESVRFRNPSDSLSILDRGETKQITFAGLDVGNNNRAPNLLIADDPDSINMVHLPETLNTLNTGDGDLIIDSRFELTADLILDTGSGDVKFSKTVDGAYALTINSSGTTTFAGAVGVATSLSSLSTNALGTTFVGRVSTSGAQTYADAVILSGNLTSVAGGILFKESVSLASAVEVSSGSGDVKFSKTVDGAYALTINSSGTTTFAGAVGVATSLASLSTNALGTTLVGRVSTTSAQTYADAVILSGNLTSGTGGILFKDSVSLASAVEVSSGSGDVKFSKTVDGAYALTINSSGTTTFAGAVGVATSLSSLSTNALGTTFVGRVSTSGAQTYADAVILSGNLTSGTGGVLFEESVSLASAVEVSSGSGDVKFSKTVDGAYALTINSSGKTTFAGAVGVATSLSSLSTDSSGTTFVGRVSTTGAQTYADAVILSGHLTSVAGGILFKDSVSLASAVEVSSGSGDVKFSKTVDGAYALTINSGGTTTFAGAVGEATSLASLSTDVLGTTLVGRVSTSGAQTYADAVTLSGNLTSGTGGILFKESVSLASAVEVSSGSGDAKFSKTVDGAYALTINSSGKTTFAGAVGEATSLSSLSTDSSGTTFVGRVSTSGAQTYADVVLLSGNLTSVAGGILFKDSVSLASAVEVSSGSGDVKFSKTVDGAYALTINSSGTTTFAGAVGVATSLSSLSTNALGTTFVGRVSTSGAQTYADAVILSGNLTSVAGGILFKESVSLASAVEVSSGSGDVKFSKTVDGAYALKINSSGTTTFAGAVGVATSLSSLSTDSSGTTFVGRVSTSGAQTYADAVILSGNLTSGTGGVLFEESVSLASAVEVSSGSGDVKFSKTVDGAYALTINSSGKTTFAGAVGVATSLSSLSTDSSGTTFVGRVSTTGAQTYADAVILSGHLTSVAGGILFKDSVSLASAVEVSSGSGDVKFSKTVDGAYALTINSGGTTTFAGAVGEATSLASLSTDVLGTTLVGRVSTSGAQTYADAVTLSGNLTSGTGGILFKESVSLASAVEVSSGSGDAKFSKTVDGAYALKINSGGTTTFAGAVGEATSLASLSTDVLGTTLVGRVSTSGAQTYADAVTLSGNLTSGTGGILFKESVSLASAVEVSSGSGDAKFSKTVDGAYALTINSSGKTTFAGAVGEATSLSSLSTDSSGTTFVGRVSTTGAQTYADAVILSGNLTSGTGGVLFEESVSLASAVEVSSGSGDVKFSKTVDGAYALTINSSGTTTFAGAVGEATSLSSLSTDSSGTTFVGRVSTSGAQTYADVVLLSGNLTSGTGGVLFEESVSLASAVEVSSGSGDVKFSKTVDGAYALTINSSGKTTFAGAVGVGTSLSSLSTDSSGTTFVGRVSTSGAQTYADVVLLSGNLTSVAGGILFKESVSLASAVEVSSGSGDVKFSKTVDGAYALTINSGGTTTFAGAVGVGTSLSSLSTDSSGTTFVGRVSTSGAQTYADAVLLSGNLTSGTGGILFKESVSLASAVEVSSGSGDVKFSKTVDGAYALTINSSGKTTFAGAVGVATSLSSLSTDSSGTTFVGRVSTTGAQTYADVVILSGNLTSGTGGILFKDSVSLASAVEVSSGSGDVKFSKTVDGAYALKINSSGTTTFAGAVGVATSLSSLSTNALGTTFVGRVSTSGAQTYADAVILSGNLTSGTGGVLFEESVSLASAVEVSSGSGDVKFSKTVDGAYALTINSGGTTTFAGAVGEATSLASLSTDVLGTTLVGRVSTSGAQTYADAVTLSGNLTSGTGGILFKESVSLASAVEVSFGSGDVKFSAAVDGDYSLEITAGEGSVTFAGPVGGTKPLQSLVIQSAGTLQMQAVTVGSLRQLSGTGETRLSGALTLTGGQSGVDVLLLETAGTIMITDQGSIHAVAAVKPNIRLSSGLENVLIGGEISVTGDIEITAANDIRIASAMSAGKTIRVTADVDMSQSGRIVSTSGILNAQSVVLKAAEGIGNERAVTIQARNLSAENTWIGSIQVSDTSQNGSLQIEQVINRNGSVVLSTERSLAGSNDGLTKIEASSLTLIAGNGNIGFTASDFFSGGYSGMTVNLTGTLTVEANGLVAITGRIPRISSIQATTGYVSSKVDLHVEDSKFFCSNLALITSGALVISDVGLAVDGMLRLEADRVYSENQGTSIFLGTETAPSAQLVYKVSDAGDRIVVIRSKELDVQTSSDVHLRILGGTLVKDLNQDQRGLSTEARHIVVLDVSGGDLKQDVISSRAGILTKTLVLLSDSSGISLQHTENDIENLVGSSAGRIEYRDSNSLNVGSVSPGDRAAVQSGLTTTGDAASIWIQAESISQAGAISTTGRAEIVLQANVGSVTMHQSASIHSEAGSISLSAAGDLRVSQIVSSLGDVVLTAGKGSGSGQTGAITDAVGATVAISTNGKTILSATNGIGDADNVFNTRIASLEATNLVRGGIWITEQESLIISGNGLRNDGESGHVQVNVQSGSLTVLSNSSGVLSSKGSIELQADEVTAASLVRAAGNVTLQARLGNVNVLNSTEHFDVDAGSKLTIRAEVRDKVFLESGVLLQAGHSVVETIPHQLSFQSSDYLDKSAPLLLRMSSLGDLSFLASVGTINERGLQVKLNWGDRQADPLFVGVEQFRDPDRPGNLFLFKNKYLPYTTPLTQPDLSASVTVAPPAAFHFESNTGVAFATSRLEFTVQLPGDGLPVYSRIRPQMPLAVASAPVIVLVSTEPTVLEAADSGEAVVVLSEPTAVQPSAPRLELRVIRANGEQTLELPLELLSDGGLLELLRRLPDDHYRVVLAQENEPERIVLDVVIRDGQPSEVSGGGDESSVDEEGGAASDRSDRSGEEANGRSVVEYIRGTEERVAAAKRGAVIPNDGLAADISVTAEHWSGRGNREALTASAAAAVFVSRSLSWREEATVDRGAMGLHSAQIQAARARQAVVFRDGAPGARCFSP